MSSPGAALGKRSSDRESSIEVRQTEDGLHLGDSILWFDSQNRGELSFLSSALMIQQSKVPQVLATEETCKILEVYRKKPNALVCQYNRPFSIGRLKMELLPSGCILGGSSLFVETEKGRLLYAPHLQIHRSPILRQVQLKKANCLILAAPLADPALALPNRRREKDRLIETVKKFVSQSSYPVILCEPLGLAQEITKWLCDEEIAVAVHDTIFKVNQVYDSFGSRLGEYTRFSRRHTKQKVVLMPLPSRRSYVAAAFADAPIISVEPTLEPWSPYQTAKSSERFVISAYCDAQEMKDIISQVGPRELYLFGPYAKRYVDTLQGCAQNIRPLFVNDQPTLF